MLATLALELSSSDIYNGVLAQPGPSPVALYFTFKPSVIEPAIAEIEPGAVSIELVIPAASVPDHIDEHSNGKVSESKTLAELKP